jgi:hypothetical protein
VAISSFAALAFLGSRISEAVTKVFNLEIAVGRLREAQEAELQADCGIPSCTFSVLRADDASRIKPASCVYRPEPTAISRFNGFTTFFTSFAELRSMQDPHLIYLTPTKSFKKLLAYRIIGFNVAMEIYRLRREDFITWSTPSS